jgi:glycosyltransferase involved in cell wall biosynthesis
VATEVGGLPDIVINRVTGLLIPPRDTRAIADSIPWFIANKPEGRALAQAGRRLTVSRYTTEATVNHT